jgi:hypothetical protein
MLLQPWQQHAILNEDELTLLLLLLFLLLLLLLHLLLLHLLLLLLLLLLGPSWQLFRHQCLPQDRIKGLVCGADPHWCVLDDN